MVSLRAYLQTRVARRIFGLFLVCAVVPTVTLTAGGYWLVNRELRSQATWQLAQAGKISGALLLARLHAADEELVEVRDRIRERRLRSIQVSRMRGLVLARAGAPHSLISGTAPTALPPITEKIADHLANGRAALLVHAERQEPRVFLVRNVANRSSVSRLWGELSPGYLWGDTESLATGAVCVYSAALPDPLYCSSGSGLRRPQEAEPTLAGNRSSKTVNGESTLFLGFDFAAPLWKVVLEHPVISHSAVEQFRRTVALVAVLGLSVVVFASNVLLRHRWIPWPNFRSGPGAWRRETSAHRCRWPLETSSKTLPHRSTRWPPVFASNSSC